VTAQFPGTTGMQVAWGYAPYFNHTFAYEIFYYGIYFYGSILLQRVYKPPTNSFRNTLSKTYVNKYF
jgi:hypothetical protein